MTPRQDAEMTEGTGEAEEEADEEVGEKTEEPPKTGEDASQSQAAVAQDDESDEESESVVEKSSSEDQWSEKADAMSENSDSDDDSVRRRRKKKIKRRKLEEEERKRIQAEEAAERERKAREEEEEEERKRAEEALVVSRTAELAGMRASINNRRSMRSSTRGSVRMSVGSAGLDMSELGGGMSLESARKALAAKAPPGEEPDEWDVEDVIADVEEEKEDHQEVDADDEAWKDEAEHARMGRVRRVFFQCCRVKSRMRRYHRVRNRFRKRYHRCCRPFSRVLKFFDHHWIRFEDANRVSAWFTKCFLCPLFMVLRCSLYCLGCPRHDKPKEDDSRLSIARRSRLSISSALPDNGEAEETDSARRRRKEAERQAKLPPRSHLKRPRPRAQKDQVMKRQGQSDTRTPREKFRHMTGRGKVIEDHSAQMEFGTDAALPVDDEQPKFSIRDLRWAAFFPWNWHDTYELWKYSRKGFWEKLEHMLSQLEEEEEWDFDNLNENGMPTQRVHTRPKWVRRNTRIFLFAYWDPFVDGLPSLKSVLMAMRWLVLILPISIFAVFASWLMRSMQTNMEYVEGDCEIESLPMVFKTKKGIRTTVSGTYTIRRFYEPSPLKPEGSVVQACNVTVPCHQEDLGRGDTDEDDKCDGFEMWARNDEILCYYNEADFYGDKNTQVFCLGRPSDLKQESFGVALAGLALGFSFLVALGILYRRWLNKRSALRDMHDREEKEAQEAKSLEARVQQEAKEAEEQAAKAMVEMENWENEMADDEDSEESA
mmetsp:Transcript_87092/g.154091  ORF Transcript_87092/g.154091 Transcript_87092/m.154091 type:complete len:770 (+) Transcript_87092:70-2379(+)|eukprot:CAMPEP_0197658496 /NCGR_PEP_ID=MMETSP1338-20131121/45273_1 /TAXON_ID=43686 ORGANISM="Pelagodinium beii, Strain RCC1491" /NCGR_SAMPLE_ID=MMETSP1338 /ASSEMBLY_ACC=CAM_ASM_000754 /LENGTH=769 /DNA_ID=CAMNT_0043235097 /DNA_START=70 /DNA_END=2379 /DNA_ORIENTATION=+